MKLPLVLLSALSAAFLLPACEKRPASPATPTPEPKLAATTPTATTPPPATAAAVPAAPASTPPAAPTVPARVDADEFLRSFGSTGPEEQSRVGKAAQALRAENYASALEILDHLLAQGHLTPEQKQRVSGVISQIRASPPSKP